MKMDRKMSKIKKILGEDSTFVVLTEDAGLVNGNTFEILMRIQRVLAEIVDRSGFPREQAKDLIDVAFMSDEELEKELEMEQEKLEKNLEKLTKNLKKATKKIRREHETSNKQK